MSAKVRRPKGQKLYAPMEAIGNELFGMDSAARRWLFAMLAVMTETQQVRVLNQFGWVEVPTTVPAAPASKGE